MTPEELRAVIGLIVDTAAKQRLEGRNDYALGLMDAADRLRRFLPAETTSAPSEPAQAPTAAPEHVSEAPDAVDEKPKRKYTRKPKGI